MVSYPLPSLFFPVGYAHAQLRSLYTLDAAHVRKYTKLSPAAQLQCSHSGAEVPGNEASKAASFSLIPKSLSSMEDGLGTRLCTAVGLYDHVGSYKTAT